MAHHPRSSPTPQSALEAARANGALDLGRLRDVPADVATAARRHAEGKLGLRCHGCERRIDGLGFKFTHLEPTMDSTGPGVNVKRVAACSRDDCDFAERARVGATCVEQIELRFIDGLGDDAPEAEGVGPDG